MKKVYSSPEAELMCFLPCERLATSGIQWKPEIIASSGATSPSIVDVPVPTNPEGDM